MNVIINEKAMSWPAFVEALRQEVARCQWGTFFHSRFKKYRTGGQACDLCDSAATKINKRLMIENRKIASLTPIAPIVDFGNDLLGIGSLILSRNL